MMEKEKQKQIEQKAIQLNLFENKLKELEQQMMMIEKQMNEFQLAHFALDEIKDVKKETEIFAPISPGIFLKAKLLNNSEVIIDSGSKVFCKKNIDEAKEFLDKKINNIIELHKKVTIEINKLVEVVTKLQEELNKELNEQD